MVGINDLGGLFQPLQFCGDSTRYGDLRRRTRRSRSGCNRCIGRDEHRWIAKILVELLGGALGSSSGKSSMAEMHGAQVRAEV